jgi:nicotinamide mononucleotide transporter
VSASLPQLEKRLLWPAGIFAAALMAASWRGWIAVSVPEAFGFVAGAICVWLVVKENIWNFSLGIANNAFFLVLFWRERLFAGMALQVVYVVLNSLGWYWWLRGGEQHSALRVSRAGRAMLGVLAGLIVAGTWLLTRYLATVNDPAPLLDALTTTLSLAAQFLMARKHLENWLVWITADVLFIGLYISRELYLTAVLYVIFLLMCLVGLKHWRASMRAAASATRTIPSPPQR